MKARTWIRFVAVPIAAGLAVLPACGGGRVDAVCPPAPPRAAAGLADVPDQAPSAAPSAAPAAQSAPPPERPEDIKKLYDAFLDAPDRQESLWTLARMLPKSGSRVIVDGDVAVSVDGLARYLLANLRLPEGANILTGGFLTANEWAGKPDYLSVRADRRLTYAVARASFPTEAQYGEVAQSFEAAAAEWEKACPECGISFKHDRGLDVQEGLRPRKDLFVVRYHDKDKDPQTGRDAYIALAFFPRDPIGYRYVNVSPAYFQTTYDHVGVFRHEIGHVLGYRHEHLRSGAPGCLKYAEGEDLHWIGLGAYDPSSVMHYPCGSAGSVKFILSDNDKRKHRALYVSGQWQ